MNILNEKKLFQHFRNFEKAISSYTFDIPFSRFLTQFYKENKQMGSSDRRMNTRLCYNYFRLGKALFHLDLIERLVVAEFLVEEESNFVLFHKPEWNAYQQETLENKLAFLQEKGYTILPHNFPFVEELSSSIDEKAFLINQFTQPDLFLRLKRGHEKEVYQEFDRFSISFTKLSDQAVSLQNGTNLQQFKNLQGKFEVQDLSSQRTLDFIKAQEGESWWDCCAASGGKALMMLDKAPTIDLLVSDIRLSILRNLDERFDNASIKRPYRKKIIDLTKSPSLILKDELFDGIVLDAPCSGSGTWGRTPEMISIFKKQDIKYYSDLQKTIARNVIGHLKKGQPLVYITCSVFREENEEVVAYMVDKLGLTLEQKKLLKGYDIHADSMFVARLIK